MLSSARMLTSAARNPCCSYVKVTGIATMSTLQHARGCGTRRPGLTCGNALRRAASAVVIFLPGEASIAQASTPCRTLRNASTSAQMAAQV